MADSPKRLPAARSSEDPTVDADDVVVILQNGTEYHRTSRRREYYAEYKLSISAEAPDAVIIPAIEATKREHEHTLQEKERTAQGVQLTWQHAMTAAVAAAGILAAALVPGAAVSIAAMVGVLGGVYLVNRIFDRRTSRALPPREDK